MTESVQHAPGEALPAPLRPGVSRIVVVMPAHNEDEHLPRALAALGAAADALHKERPDVATTVMVVLDSCTDQSAEITAGYVSADLRFSAVDVGLGSIGASRAVGVATALAASGPVPHRNAERIWLANTDADSAVPEHWLVRQLEMADAGADVILGSVQPDPIGMDPLVLSRWLARHPFREDHPHIYGANFGVRGSAYLAVGGFPRLPVHEDRSLVEQLRRHGFAVVATDRIRVLTSGRTHARAPQGFGSYLRALGRELPAAACNFTSA
ncbi:glycosyltransferase [Arthrobacter sp. MA-N2]|uniref:glycosyltransferase n=1 Tax=Arthrobacter sp. MA-N2 TaxID=1101188 RepID=UPI0009DFBD9D|nr:glycosyltransferase [Arthrobacter sp. MA-N2]